MKNIITLALFVLTSLIFANPEPVSACSCVAPSSPSGELGKSEAVFVGTVTNIEAKNKVSDKLGLGSSADLMLVTISVSKAWKGIDQKNITVTTAKSSASCGFSFEKGKEYIVYANSREEGLHVSLCSRTSLVENAQKDLQELGKAENIKENNDNTNKSPRSALSVSVIGGIVGLVFVIIVVLFVLTNRHSDK